MKTRPLPRMDSVREMARFWDCHDLTDFEEHLEEITEPVFEPRNIIPLCLEPAEAQAVHRLARTQGVPDAELIRGWVREKIHPV